MYQGGFGIAGKDELADALLLLGLHQLRSQQPLGAAGPPCRAGEGPAHAAHGPAALPAPWREPIGEREARRAPPPSTTTYPLSECPVSDSGMRQVAAYQGKGGACGGAAPVLSSAGTDGRALTWSGGRRDHSECTEQENDAGRSQSAGAAAAEGGPDRSVSCGCWLQVGVRCSEGALSGD